MPLSTEVGFSTGDIVLDGESAPPKKGHSLHFSVHVYCVQTAGWIKMPLGTKIGFGPGHNVLNGDPSPQRWHSPHFRPMSIVSKRLDGSRCHLVWGRPRPRAHCVRWGPRSTLPKKGAEPPSSPILGPFLLWPNGCMHQDATWYGVGLSPGDFVLDGNPAPF